MLICKTVNQDLENQKNQIVRLITNKAECKIDTSLTCEVDPLKLLFPSLGVMQHIHWGVANIYDTNKLSIL